MNLKKNDRELGFYREMLECIYSLCLEYAQAPVKKTRPGQMAIENGLNVLTIHGINTKEIIQSEYQET